jgi:PAS domain S-box-containing protein
VRKYGWAVVAEQPAVAAFATKTLLLRRLLLAYSLTGLFCVAAIYLISRIVIQYRQTKELQESEQRYRYLFESNPMPMWIVDVGTQEFLVVNDEAVEALGYTRAEFLAMTSFDLRTPEDRVIHEEAIRNLDPLARVRRQVKLLRKDGVARDMEITAHPFVFEGRQARLVLVNDITDRLRAEEEIHKLNTGLERRVIERTSQLEASNKELESFSYSVSHDLRSPLRAIGGFARILAEDYGDKLDDEGRRLLGVVRDNSQRMGELIDDLLEFSRLGRKSLSAAEINIERLVEEVLEELQAGSERRAAFKLGPLPPSYGDAVLIKQAWANLLGNAIKFSNKREQPVIEVSGHENGAENVYCVKDNGAGFDMRYYDKLFGVFQRLHSADEFDGTGVGLAIVQRVVARHSGRVWAKSEVGKGAAFYFSLPRENQIEPV